MTANPCLDSEILSTLRDIMGDDYALLIETYLNDSAMRIAALVDGIADRDADVVRRTAHSFKGSSSNIGALRLAEYCGAMEASALAGNAALWNSQLTLIEGELTEVARLLQQ